MTNCSKLTSLKCRAREQITQKCISCFCCNIKGCVKGLGFSVQQRKGLSFSHTPHLLFCYSSRISRHSQQFGYVSSVVWQHVEWHSTAPQNSFSTPFQDCCLWGHCMLRTFLWEHSGKQTQMAAIALPPPPLPWWVIGTCIKSHNYWG